MGNNSVVDISVSRFGIVFDNVSKTVLSDIESLVLVRLVKNVDFHGGTEPEHVVGIFLVKESQRSTWVDDNSP